MRGAIEVRILLLRIPHANAGGAIGAAPRVSLINTSWVLMKVASWRHLMSFVAMVVFWNIQKIVMHGNVTALNHRFAKADGLWPTI